MKQWTQIIGTGRSQIEVRVTAKEPHERTPEEHARCSEALRMILGEPTPEMFERKSKARRRGAKKGGR
jgi:hypothetical protein